VNCLASSSYGGAADEGRYGFGFESTSTLERPDGSPHTEQPFRPPPLIMTRFAVFWQSNRAPSALGFQANALACKVRGGPQ
jgi:hypothetical protein